MWAGPLETRREEVAAFRVKEKVTPEAVLTSPPAAALLRSNLPLHRHISRQLGHKNFGMKDRSSSTVLKFKKKAVQGGSGKAHRVCNPGQALTVCAVAGMWHLTPADFCFLVSPPLRSGSQTLAPLPSAQHASYHVTGTYHFPSCGRGVVRRGGGCIFSRCCAAVAA